MSVSAIKQYTLVTIRALDTTFDFFPTNKRSSNKILLFFLKVLQSVIMRLIFPKLGDCTKSIRIAQGLNPELDA